MATQTVSMFPGSNTQHHALQHNHGFVSNVQVIAGHGGVLNAVNTNKLPAATVNYAGHAIRKKQRLTPLGDSSVTLNAANVAAVHVVRKTPGPKRPRVTHQVPVQQPQQQQVQLLRNGENIAPAAGAAVRLAPVTKSKNGSGSSTATAHMPPVSVARRNARERNRVKQVNNGFSALRDRIPDEVAEIFETHGTGRGSVKKLSKVETLRMAVEYIRSLEQCLVDDGVVLPEPADADCFDFSGGEFGGNDTNNNSRVGDVSSLEEEGGSPLQPQQLVHDEVQLVEEIVGGDEEEVGEVEEEAEGEGERTIMPSVTRTAGSEAGSFSSFSAAGSQEFIRLPAGGTFQISTPIYERDESVGGTVGSGIGLLPHQHQYAGIAILDAATGFVHHPQQQHNQQQQQQLQLQQLQQQLQQQHQQQQLLLQQNMMLMSPAASISPNSYATQAPSPADVGGAPIKTEDECYVILPPLHADGGVYYAALPDDSLSPVYGLKTEHGDETDGERLLLSEQEQADSIIGSSLEWWQRTDEQRQHLLLQQQQQQLELGLEHEPLVGN